MSYLNYEPDILERIDTLAKSQDSRKKIFDEISQILLDRAKLEEFYARSQERLCEGLAKIKINNNDCLKQIVLVLQTLFSSQAEQSQTFGSSIINEIIPGMKDIFKDDVYTLKHMQKIGERHEKELIKQVQGFDKMRKQYVQMSQVVERKVKEQKAFELQLDQQMKINEKTQDINIINQLKKRKGDLQKEQQVLDCMYRQKLNSENELQGYIQKYNQYIDEYFLDVARIEDQILNQEIQKRDQVKDSIMKYLVFKISQVRNEQYDVDRITTKLEEIDSKQGTKQYLNDMLNQYKDYKNNSQIKPLLCKLNFDNYKQFIDTKMASNNSSNQNPPAVKQHHHHHHHHNQNNNNSNNQQPQQQQQQQEQKPRPKIFQQQSVPSVPPAPINNINRAISDQDVAAQQKRPHTKIFQALNMVPRKISNEVSDNFMSQQQQQQQQPSNNQLSFQQQRNLDIIVQKQQQSPQQQKGEQIQEQQDGRVILVKTDSNHIKQPTEYKFIDIMAMMKEKQQSLQMKRVQQGTDSSPQQQEVLEIEREDLFEYILLKIWNNNELQTYDVDQLKSIIERDSGSRKAFSNFYCSFFGDLIKEHTHKLVADEKDIVNRLLLEKGKVEIVIEINSDAYTYLMRILYCVLDVLNTSNDLHCISDIYRISKSIFKVIRPPDEDIKSFERIFLHQGLSGHQLFSNQNHWQNKLKTIIEQLESTYEQRVRNNSSVSDTDEIKVKRSISENDKGSEHISDLDEEGKFVYSRLLISIRDLFEFEISKEQIIQIIKNLVEEAVLTSDVGKYLIVYTNQYEKKDVAVMQSEEISSEKASQNDQILNLQNIKSKEEENEEIKDYKPSQSSPSSSSSLSSSSSHDNSDKQKNIDPTNPDYNDVESNSNLNQQVKEPQNEEIHQNEIQDDKEESDQEDNSQEIENQYAEGLS